MARNGVFTNGAEIKRLRLEKGLTIEGLASALADAGCPLSKNTIERAEKGLEPVTITTVRYLAKFFGAENWRLLRDTPPVPNDQDLAAMTPEDAEVVKARLEIKKTGKTVVVTLAGTLEELTEEKLEFFMDHIRRAAQGEGKYIQIIYFDGGSVRLILQMTGEQARKLKRMVDKGELSDVGVLEARILSLGSKPLQGPPPQDRLENWERFNDYCDEHSPSRHQFEDICLEARDYYVANWQLPPWLRRATSKRVTPERLSRTVQLVIADRKRTQEMFDAVRSRLQAVVRNVKKMADRNAAIARLESVQSFIRAFVKEHVNKVMIEALGYKGL